MYVYLYTWTYVMYEPITCIHKNCILHCLSFHIDYYYLFLIALPIKFQLLAKSYLSHYLTFLKRHVHRAYTKKCLMCLKTRKHHKEVKVYYYGPRRRKRVMWCLQESLSLSLPTTSCRAKVKWRFRFRIRRAQPSPGR